MNFKWREWIIRCLNSVLESKSTPSGTSDASSSQLNDRSGNSHLRTVRPSVIPALGPFEDDGSLRIRQGSKKFVNPGSLEAIPADQLEGRPQIFDPALREFNNGYVCGEPAFNDEEQLFRFRVARRCLMEHLLRLIHYSKFRDNLVLRGSLLLKTWFPELSREPGDLDWVVVPDDLDLANVSGRELIQGLADLIKSHPSVKVSTPVSLTNSKGDRHQNEAVRTSAWILVDRIAIDEIWTYDRVPGVRIVLPWQSDNLPVGSMQMDFVFGEQLWSLPVETQIPTLEGDSISLLTATRELSLAWKLLWLDSDKCPQGKDLFDAVLLAENTKLSVEFLRRALEESQKTQRQKLGLSYAGHQKNDPDFPMKWKYIDWENFRTEYPWIQGEASDWQSRLCKALTPTIEALSSSSDKI